MTENKTLFYKLLSRLDSEGILANLILIGSWVLPIYRHYFNNAPEIPLLRTTDLDFLIPNPPKIAKSIDIPAILKEYDFEQVFSNIGNYTKFINPSLEVEFIIPELGRGSKKAYWIKELKVTAQPLRYLYLIQKFVLKVKYRKIELNVPEPAAFTLLKFLLTLKRKDKSKIDKDLYMAKGIAYFLISISDQRILLKLVYDSMPDAWHKKLIPILEEHCPELLELIRGSAK